LRISGAIIGVVLGIGSQVFILPHLDSIASFTLLFLAATIPATWIATSGPRLSYCCVQILIAFYLINLGEFRVPTSLEPGTDRAIGIFLGLLMMWLVFDQLSGAAPPVHCEHRNQFWWAKFCLRTNRPLTKPRSMSKFKIHSGFLRGFNPNANP